MIKLDNLMSIWKEKCIIQSRMKREIIQNYPNPAMSCIVSSRAAAVRIDKIKHPITKELCTKEADILNAFECFYSDLYASKGHDPEALNELLKHWKKPSVDFTGLTTPFTDSELMETINSFNDSKAPGHDGFSIKPYKLLSPEQRVPLLNVMNHCLTSGIVPSEWKRGVITTLFKKGDPLEIGNRRPITLLTIDYKILSKMLTARLNKIIGAYYHTLQERRPT